MTVKKLLELLKEVNISYSSNNKCITVNVNEIIFWDKHHDHSISRANIEQILNNEVVSLGKTSCGYYFAISENIEENEKELITVEDLFNFLSKSYVKFLYELIIKKGKETTNWKYDRSKIEGYGLVKPWGWDKIKQMEVEKITCITEDHKMQIVVIDNTEEK